MSFIGKEIIVQTLDTFSYALSRRWTISEISHPVTIDVTSDLMNHMSEPLLSAYGAQNTVIIVFFAFLSAQWLKSRAKSRKLHSCVLVIVHRERPGALTAERQASVGAALRRVPLEAHVLPLPFLGFNFYQLHSTLTSSDLGNLNRHT